MYSQDEIIGPLISCNQSEKCLKLGLLLLTELPTEFTVAIGRNIKSTVFGFQLDAMIALYCPRTNRVNNMLLTMRSHPEIESTLDQKPSIILFHNKTKDGVGILDRMLRSYSIKRVTTRWPLVLFQNMIDVGAINAFMQGINRDGCLFR